MINGTMMSIVGGSSRQVMTHRISGRRYAFPEEFVGYRIVRRLYDYTDELVATGVAGVADGTL